MFIKLNDGRLVNLDKVAYVKLVTLDTSEILWDGVVTTGGIEYVLITTEHITERYESEQDAEDAFDELEYTGFIALENNKVIVNTAFIKDVKQDTINDVKVEYITFNGLVEDVFATADAAATNALSVSDNLAGVDNEEDKEEDLTPKE